MARVLRAEFRTNPAPTYPSALSRRATIVGCYRAKKRGGGATSRFVSFFVVFGRDPNALKVGKSMGKLLITVNHCF